MTVSNPTTVNCLNPMMQLSLVQCCMRLIISLAAASHLTAVSTGHEAFCVCAHSDNMSTEFVADNVNPIQATNSLTNVLGDCRTTCSGNWAPRSVQHQRVTSVHMTLLLVKMQSQSIFDQQLQLL